MGLLVKPKILIQQPSKDNLSKEQPRELIRRLLFLYEQPLIKKCRLQNLVYLHH
jgi:hypothetical protein